MKSKVCFLVSSPLTARAFLNGHFKALSSDFDVDLIANFSGFPKEGLNVGNVIDVAIDRKINLRSDIVALFKLYKILSSNRYDVVHTVTPKAGLLGMIAGFMARVPVRFHTYTGQVWVTKKGFSRFVLKFLDKVIFFFSTFALVDSKSQKYFLIEQAVITDDGSEVLASGSISGVDTQRFSVNNDSRALIRQRYSISDDDLLFLFLGRVNEDKGVRDLVDAYKNVKLQCPRARLMIVGPDEDGVLDDVDFDCESIIRVGFTKSPEDYFNAADIFCLPSYREGFGSVIIEAAACATPALASRIYGVTDAVDEEVTGILHSPGVVVEIERGMIRYLDDDAYRKRSAMRAYERARDAFSSDVVESSMLDFYKSVCG
jgi:glycosyltransferase involved in cell wall biosynthesis